MHAILNILHLFFFDFDPSPKVLVLYIFGQNAKTTFFGNIRILDSSLQIKFLFLFFEIFTQNVSKLIITITSLFC